MVGKIYTRILKEKLHEKIKPTLEDCGSSVGGGPQAQGVKAPLRNTQ